MKRIVRFILRIEHIIYCMTDGKVELPLHRSYYSWSERQYMSYRANLDKKS